MSDYLAYRVKNAIERSEKNLKERTEFYESELRQRYIKLYTQIGDR